MSFFIRTILALLITAGIFFLVTGGEPTKIPQPTEEGFQVDFEDSGTVEKWRKKVENIFSGNSTTTDINFETETSSSSEADVSFFEKMLGEKGGGEQIDSTTSSVDKINSDNDNESQQPKTFVQKLVDKFKEQISKVDQEEPTNAFSSKESNIPSFTTACFPDVKQICSPNGCSKSEPKVEFTLLDKEKSLIAHCDSGGCVSYNAEYESVENYENYQPDTPKGYIITKEKNSSDSSSKTAFIEVVTKGIKTTMYSGYCMERKPGN